MVGDLRTDMRNKKRILVLALSVGFAVLLAIYLGHLSHQEDTPWFEITEAYSLSLGENEEVSVRRVIVSDLTGDGQKELLISYEVLSHDDREVEGGGTGQLSFEEAKILILSCGAEGSFEKLWEYDAGLTRQTVAIADFGDRSKPSIVLGGVKVENEEELPASAICRVEILCQEDAGFVQIFSSNVSGLFGPGSIVTEDFDGDGRTDFIVGGVALEDGSQYHAYLFRNDGGGNFTLSPIAIGEMVIVDDMWEADINGDGSPDLIIRALDRDDQTWSMILLLNDGSAQFEIQELNVSTNLIVIDDFAADGFCDIIYTEETRTGSEGYFLRNEQGEFVRPTLIIIGKGRWFSAIIVGDFNSDSAPDVIFVESRVGFSEDEERFEISLMGHLLLIEVNAEGELSYTHEWSQEFLKGKDISSGHAKAVGDINGDGRNDLILVSQDGRIYLALNQHG